MESDKHKVWGMPIPPGFWVHLKLAAMESYKHKVRGMPIPPGFWGSYWSTFWSSLILPRWICIELDQAFNHGAAATVSFYLLNDATETIRQKPRVTRPDGKMGKWCWAMRRDRNPHLGTWFKPLLRGKEGITTKLTATQCPLPSQL